MTFRTEIQLAESKRKIQTEDCIFSIGSCFSTEISSIFSSGQIQTCNNPFGTIFHPIAINNAIKRIYDKKEYTENDLIFYQGKYISLDHHTSFDDRDLDKSLEKINNSLNKAIEFLKKTKWIIITYGTSWIYEFNKLNKIVANCHKIPQKKFHKRLLTYIEIKDSISETINIIKDISLSKDLQVLFTISPVRHIKDGFTENQRSKSLLNVALHELIEISENCEYLPIYEMLMDDLRDYRFYKEDLIHPNKQALQYIWEKFSKAYLSPETFDFIKDNLKINQAFQHRFIEEENEEKKIFTEKLKDRIDTQKKKVNHSIFSNFTY